MHRPCKCPHEDQYRCTTFQYFAILNIRKRTKMFASGMSTASNISFESCAYKEVSQSMCMCLYQFVQCSVYKQCRVVHIHIQACRAMETQKPATPYNHSPGLMLFPLSLYVDWHRKDVQTSSRNLKVHPDQAELRKSLDQEMDILDAPNPNFSFYHSCKM